MASSKQAGIETALADTLFIDRSYGRGSGPFSNLSSNGLAGLAHSEEAVTLLTSLGQYAGFLPQNIAEPFEHLDKFASSIWEAYLTNYLLACCNPPSVAFVIQLTAD